MPRLIYIFFALFAAIIAVSSPIPPVYADTEADFKFMDLRRQLREHPDGPEARHYLFSIGEYYFEQDMPTAASDCFVRMEPEASRGTEDLLALVYLARCAQVLKNQKMLSFFDAKLQDALASRGFFALFNSARSGTWRSTFGNRFDFKEEVDRLEIRLNEKPFYAISLS